MDAAGRRMDEVSAPSPRRLTSNDNGHTGDPPMRFTGDPRGGVSERPKGIIGGMGPASLPPPVLIKDQPELERLATSLSGQRRVAVDTESNSLYAYRERVCLVQFSPRSADYLVDRLAMSALTSLAPIFSNPKIEKGFHAAEDDILCLKRG